MNRSQTINRRSALAVFSGAIAAFWTGCIAAVAGAFISTPLSAARKSRNISLGQIDSLQAGFRSVELKNRANDGWYSHEEMIRVYARVDESGTPIVFSGTCTHLGCTVNWDESERVFKCPCHGGVYGEDGTVKAGPPPRPLTQLPAEVRDGQVFARLG